MAEKTYTCKLIGEGGVEVDTPVRFKNSTGYDDLSFEYRVKDGLVDIGCACFLISSKHGAEERAKTKEEIEAERDAKLKEKIHALVNEPAAPVAVTGQRDVTVILDPTKPMEAGKIEP